jgi:hypothetical protein
MSYRNPRLVIDTKLGDAFIESVKNVGKSIEQTVFNYAEVARKNKEQNFKIKKEANQYDAKVSSNLAKIAVDNDVPAMKLIDAFKVKSDEYKKAKLIEQYSEGEYEGMEDNQKMIRDFEVLMNGGLQQQIGALTTNLEEAGNAMLKGFDSKNGISSTLDPRAQIMLSSANGVNNVSATTRYDMVDGDLLYIVEGKAIEELNKEMGIEGDSYTLSSKTIFDRTTLKGSSSYNHSFWDEMPDINGTGEEGSLGIKRTLLDQKIIETNGEFNKEYTKNYGRVLRKQEIEGYGVESSLSDVMAIDVEKASANLKLAVDATVNTWLSYTGPEIFNYIRTTSEIKTIDGEDYFAHKPVEGRDSSGEVQRGEEFLISEKELANKDYALGKFGFTDETVDKIRKIALDDALKTNGALKEPIYANKTSTDVGKTKSTRVSKLVNELAIKNAELAASGRADEIDYSQLGGLKGGATIEKDGNVMRIYGAPNAKGIQQEIGVFNPGDAEEASSVLINFYEPTATDVVKNKKDTTTKTPAIIGEMTNPIMSMGNNITEEDFMDKLSDGYLKNLSKFGIRLEETNIGDDALLLTKPNGDEVEIDLEQDGWKDVYAREIKSAIEMSPAYKESLNKSAPELPKIAPKLPGLEEEKKNNSVESGSKSSSESDFIDKLMVSESSGDYEAKIIDSKGRRFVGLLQFGEDRLKDYKEATGESFTQDEFLLDNNLQDKVNVWHIKDLDREIDSLGDLSKKFSRNGLRAVAHLGGVEGMKKWVRGKSGGKAYNESDELGTSQDSYYNKYK